MVIILIVPFGQTRKVRWNESPIVVAVVASVQVFRCTQIVLVVSDVPFWVHPSAR